MKRIAVLLLCLCMLLPMAFAVALGTGAESNATPVISTDKVVYRPGEEIKVTASFTVSGAWVGIVPADANGDPIIAKGTIYWENVPAEGLTDFSIKDGTPIAGSNATALAELMGVTQADMLTLPAGRYFVAHINSSKGIVAATNEDPALVTYVPITVADKISMEKTTFLYGEDIVVKPLYKNTATDYVGLSRVDDEGNIQQNLYYTYITDANLNNPIVVQDGVLYGNDAEKYGRLPAGRYVVYFAPNNLGAQSRDKTSDIYIEVLGATVEKTEFKYGEPIMVKGYGAGKDWVGIAALDETNETGFWSGGSIRWRYIEPVAGKPEVETGFGSGIAFDIRDSKLAGAATARGDLPVGDYVIMVGLDDCYAYDVSPYTFIPITITADVPDAPASVSYELNDARTGLAGGNLTVTFDESSMVDSQKPTKVELYWADENGNELEGYNKIGSRKVTGATTVIELTESMVIPAGAKKLMVHAYNGAGYAAEAVAAELPEYGYRTTGEKITSFQIVSDMHIGRSNVDGNGVNMSDKHAQLMFADILALDPDSVGIFVAGDAADHGQAEEYARLFSLWQTANETAFANDLALPNLYIGVGNHEMMKDTSGHNYNSQANYTVQADRFLEYANLSLEEAEKTTTPYYYVERGGQHFIFLATEYCGTHAYLSDDQLEWLEAKLGEVAADGAPVFIMLHQPLYNTIAGGLANEDGSLRQGWHGVIAGDANFELWKTESGGALSDHGKMYGQYEAPLREILAAYPSAMMFSGHSHWIMESLGNIYEATEAQPNYMFNTASISYLWTDNDELYGGYDPGEGSQGYYVTVYENCIEFRGRDFLNGTWIPNAYYRVWLDCAHEGEVLCDTICKWCGETNTNAIPHDGEKDCDTTCKYCEVENTVADAVPCSGEFDCSTKCQYCGEAVTPRVSAHSFTYACTAKCTVCGEDNPDVVACSGEFDCSTKCQYCGEAVTPRVGTHTFTYVCDETCAECGEEIAHEEHDGLYACSDKCQWCGIDVDHEEHVGANGCEAECMYGCGTPVTGTGHEGEFACSAVCKNCNTPIEPAAHEGKALCATLCKYGCGTFIFPTARHDGALPCSETCAACGADITPEVEHDGTFDCSTECKYGCGTAITDAVECEGDFACSDVCRYCGEAVEAATCDGEFDCSTTCKYGCGAAITDAVPCDGRYDCSTACKYCGEESVTDAVECDGEFACSTTCKYGCGAIMIDAIACDGQYACSTVCVYCGEESVIDAVACDGEFDCSTECRYGCGAAITDAVDHEGAEACSTVCKYGCETEVIPTADHTAEYDCSASCAVCAEDIGHVEHEGEFDCSTTCQYGCGTAVTPNVEHTAEHDCSESCFVCEEPITPATAHTNAIACSTVCDVCGATIATDVAHTATADCSTACTVCGEALTPAVEHTTAYACDTNCSVCGEAVAHEEHDGEFACSTVCQYGCGTVMEDAVVCVGAIACVDETCQYCGEAVTLLAHEGAYNCSTVCKYGCETAMKPKRDHRKENGCSTVCLICSETLPKQAHDYDHSCDVECNECGFVRVTEHRYTTTCDTECNVCGATRTAAAHTYAGDCDNTCEICHEERDASAHTYDGDCDAVCNVCGQTREKGEHLFGDWAIVTAATTEAAGLEERTCRVCGVTESREVPKLTVDPNATDDLNKAPTVNLPVIGEVDQSTFIWVAVAAGAAILILIVVIAVVVSKKKKKKKAAKAEKGEDAKDEVEITDQAFEESETAEESADEATEGDEAEKAEETEEATEEAEETEKKDEE